MQKTIKDVCEMPKFNGSMRRTRRIGNVLTPVLPAQPPSNALKNVELSETKKNDVAISVRRRESKSQTCNIETNYDKARTNFNLVLEVDKTSSKKILAERIQKRFFKQQLRLAVSTLAINFVLILAALMIFIPRVMFINGVHLADQKREDITRYTWYFEAFVSVFNPMVLFLSRKEYRKIVSKKCRKLQCHNRIACLNHC